MPKPTDLKNHALTLLNQSQEFLIEDGDLDPVAFIITAEEQLLKPLELQDETAKINCCAEIVAAARSKRAMAIVTIFLAQSKDFDQSAFSKETYVWGDIQDDNSERCILLTISGPGIKNWATALPFSGKGKSIQFLQMIEFSNGVDLGLFPGWSEQIIGPMVS